MAASRDLGASGNDFKGLGFSKIGHFKQVRAKIGELEKIGAELSRRHSELEAVIDSMTEGLTILDQDLNIVFINKVQQALFRGRALSSRKCFQAFYQKTERCRNCPAVKTLTTKETLSGEISVDFPPNGRRHLEWSTSRIEDPLGSAPRVLLLMRDITKRKEEEMNLMRADRLATIGLLAAGIAHEINNPLTSIAGFSEGLLKRLKQHGSIEEDQLIRALEDYLQIINQEAYRCSNIIRNLIRYSQKTTENMASLDIVQIIRDTIVLIQPHARQTGIQLALNPGQDAEPLYLTGSEANLKHLCLTLLNYALEAMEGPGALNILTRGNAAEVEVIITHGNTDGSPGAPAANERAEATPPFHAVKGDIGGLPLSLSICYTIMQHHRGHISLQQGEDSSFAFVLKFPTSLP